MLICDLCDEAFHLSCCKSRFVPGDEWYCRPCLRKKPKVLPETLSGQLFYIMKQKKKRKMLRDKLGPILSMLVEESYYTSGVRIGNNYQVEVPEWSGPVSEYDGSLFFCLCLWFLWICFLLILVLGSGDDYLGNATELGPAEWWSLNVLYQSLSQIHIFTPPSPSHNSLKLSLLSLSGICLGRLRVWTGQGGPNRLGTGFSVERWSTTRQMRTTREPSAENGAGSLFMGFLSHCILGFLLINFLLVFHLRLLGFFFYS